jgi:hypothetical protein
MKRRITAGRFHAPCAAVRLPDRGCSENEGAFNHGAVEHSLCGGLPSSCFGSAYMMRGAWPPCHRAGSSVHTEGDFARDAPGRKRKNLPLKRDRSLG